MIKIEDNNLVFRFPLEKRKRTDYLVLHHSGKGFEHSHTIEEIHKAHLQRDNCTWSGFGYHYFVAKNGKITRGRPMDAVGAHTLGYNDVSISIVAEGNFDIQEVTAEQMQAIRILVGKIMEKYPNISIVRHFDLNSNNKTCPGKNFPFDYIYYNSEFSSVLPIFKSYLYSVGWDVGQHEGCGFVGPLSNLKLNYNKKKCSISELENGLFDIFEVCDQAGINLRYSCPNPIGYDKSKYLSIPIKFHIKFGEKLILLSKPVKCSATDYWCAFGNSDHPLFDVANSGQDIESFFLSVERNGI